MENVRETLDAINGAWRQRNFAAMEEHLDENVVMGGPEFKEYAKGRPAFVETYAQFMSKSHITEYVESHFAINTWGYVAAASYDWTMTYEQKGQARTEKGNNMFVFHRVSDAWAAIPRVVLF